jgi:hypothetical protein
VLPRFFCIFSEGSKIKFLAFHELLDRACSFPKKSSTLLDQHLKGSVYPEIFGYVMKERAKMHAMDRRHIK